MSFASDIDKFTIKTGIKADMVVRKLGFQALIGVMSRSPVDTGRFRASNHATVDVPDLSVAPERPRKKKSGLKIGSTPTGAEPNFMAGMARIAKAKIGQTIIISNNLVYAKVLEDGSSAQNSHAKDGIYGASFAEIQGNFEKLVGEAKADAESAPRAS
jgi:hypothetical protein